MLRGVSGCVSAGKVVGLLGRNGEGKTTLFRIMLDILAADAGKIRISGRSPDASGAIRRFAGYVPERPNFHEFMSIADVFRLRANFFPAWDSTKARKMAWELELDLTTAIRGASKGTLAKTAWICATAHNPQVLLLDEPTSGLDMVVRDMVLTHLVRELAVEGKTIMIANHHMEEHLGILDEVWLLQGGMIRGVYQMQELKNNSFRITGRLKSNAILPSGARVIEEPSIGGIVHWLVTDKESLYAIQSAALLENMQVEQLPLETTLRLFLDRGRRLRPPVSPPDQA